MIIAAKLILIFATLIAPLCLAANYHFKKPLLLNFLNKIFPLFFLLSLISISGKSPIIKFSVDIISIFNHTIIGFLIDENSYLFLCAVGAIWLIFSFYFKKISVFLGDENHQKNYQFFLAAIALIIFIIISKTILTISVFYGLALVVLYYFIRDFFNEENAKNSQFFIIICGFQASVLLIATLIAYNFNLSLNFLNKSPSLDIANSVDLTLLLNLFFIALFSSLILPFYLFFYRNLSFELKTVYVAFFLLYLVPALIFFAKILNSLFGEENLEIIFNSNLFFIFKFFILLLSAFFGVAILLNKSIKTAFFYIFLQQVFFCAFSLIFFARYNENKALLPLFTFFLEFTLLFLSIENISAYLSKASQKNLSSIFSNLIISCSLMIFAIFSLSGLAPSLGLITKFYLFKNAFQSGDQISLIIFAINSISLLLFFTISLRAIFFKSAEKINESDLELAKNLDFDSSTMFGMLMLALSLFIGLILSPWIKIF